MNAPARFSVAVAVALVMLVVGLLGWHFLQPPGDVIRVFAMLADPVRWAAANYALARTSSRDGRTAIQAFVDSLKDPEASAAPARTVIQALRDALKDSEASVRASATLALGGMVASTPEAMSALVGSLVGSVRQADHDARAAAIRLLGKIGSPAQGAKPVLLDALRTDPSATVRVAAARALARIGPTAGEIPALAEALRDADQNVQAVAAELLGEIGSAAQDAKPALLDALRTDPSATVRVAAARALGRIGPTAGEIPALAEALRDADQNVRWATTVLLGHIGAAAREAAPHLAGVLRNDTSSAVRAVAAQALGGPLGATSEGTSALIDALRDADQTVREHAAESLRLRAKLLVPVLEQDLGAPDAEVRWKAMETLRWIGPASPAEVMPMLERALEDDDPRVRSMSARGLGAIGEVALPVLRAALRHHDPGVRAAAAEAIGTLGFRAGDGVTSLIEALKDADASVRSSVVHALGVLGSEATAAVGALRRVAQSDPSPEVRALAEVAIQDIVGR